jgi:hypothetical protein
MEDKAIEIAERIKLAIGIDVFEKNRKQPIVDVRSMYCYMLRKDLNFTLHKIKDIFKSQGKQFDHSSVHHNVVLFDEVRRRNPHLNDVRDTIMGTIDPKFLLMKRIENIDDMSKISQITNCVNQYE